MQTETLPNDKPANSGIAGWRELYDPKTNTTIRRSTDPDRIVDEAELRALGVTASRSTRYAWEDAGKFPRRMKLGTGPNGKHGWRAAEITAYLRGTWKPADAPAAPAREMAVA